MKQALVPVLVLALSACKDSGWGGRAPFDAEPPPDVWVRPAEVATPEDAAGDAGTAPKSPLQPLGSAWPRWKIPRRNGAWRPRWRPALVKR